MIKDIKNKLIATSEDTIYCLIDIEGEEIFLTPIIYPLEKELFEPIVYNFMKEIFNNFKFKIEFKKNVIIKTYHEEYKQELDTLLKDSITENLSTLKDTELSIIDYKFDKIIIEDFSFKYIESFLELLDFTKKDFNDFLKRFYIERLSSKNHSIVLIRKNGEIVLENYDLEINIIREINELKVLT